MPLSRDGATRRASPPNCASRRTRGLFTFRCSRYQTPGRPSEQDVKTSGLAKTGPIRIDWSGHRDAPGLLRVLRTGDWPSGLYFLRAKAGDGRVGYAPSTSGPRQLGTLRVAVVLATNTWAAYKLRRRRRRRFGEIPGT